jgi:riboflavin synthase
VNGISLTVNSVDGDRISLCIIPVTLQKTNISTLTVGDEVNLEMDILAKYTEKLLPTHGDPV